MFVDASVHLLVRLSIQPSVRPSMRPLRLFKKQFLALLSRGDVTYQTEHSLGCIEVVLSGCPSIYRTSPAPKSIQAEAQSGRIVARSGLFVENLRGIGEAIIC